MTGPEIEDALFREAMAADAFRAESVASQEAAVGRRPQSCRPRHRRSELANARGLSVTRSTAVRRRRGLGPEAAKSQ